MSEISEGGGIYEVPADAGADDAGVVRLWIDAIHLARKQEEGWRERADKAVRRYRDDEDRGGNKFNVLYANTQILLPSLYNSTPEPDVRRRFGDEDPIGKLGAQVLERCLSYSVDVYDFDGVMRSAVFDMVLPGRGVVRVRDLPEVDESGNVVSRETRCELVHWRDFIPGPARSWEDLPWIAFEHRLTREELTERFGDVGATMALDVVLDSYDDKGRDKRDVPEVFKRGTVWEIWNKPAREVLFIAPTVTDAPLLVEPDPLNLRDFWPCPRPLYDVMDAGSLVPLVPYDLYRDQAEELDRVTARINALVQMARYRGLRAADLAEFTQLAGAKDGDFVPVQNVHQYLGSTGGGGLERAMWEWPLETIVKAIGMLELQRETVKATIYEITGLSDIVRGASKAQETATAQQIKAQFGSVRIQDRQREVQRFARDLIRIKGEIIAERFDPPQLSAMSGIELLTGQQRVEAEAAAQAGVPLPLQVQMALQAPTWDDVLGVLRSDAMRGYRVDIETDSTIAADVLRMQENAGQFVQGFAGFIQAVGPAVEAGVMPMDIVADLLTAFARQFKLGRQAEDALDRLGQVARQPKPEAPDPAAAEAQKAQMELQAKAASEQQKLAADRERAMADAALRLKDMEARQAAEAEKLALARDEMERRFTVELAKLGDSQMARGEQREGEALGRREAVIAEADEKMREMAAALAALAQAMQASAQRQETAASMQMQAVQALADVMAAPKRVIYGEDGRPAGVEVLRQ